VSGYGDAGSLLNRRFFDSMPGIPGAGYGADGLAADL
jgi:hypothetical protein